MTLLAGGRYRQRLEHGLCRLFQDVIWLPDNPSIDARLAGHTDLNVFMPDPGHIIVAKDLRPHIVNCLTKDKIICLASGKQGSVYPRDAGLCICTTGEYTIYNPKTIDPVAIPYLSGTLIRVPQGYTKCSVSVVSDVAIITSDDAIAKSAADAEMDVLRIRPGNIELDGFEYGFIGGASFRIDSHTIAFTGTLGHHPDCRQILAFLRKHGAVPVFLSDDPLFDIGGAVVLP